MKRADLPQFVQATIAYIVMFILFIVGMVAIAWWAGAESPVTSPPEADTVATWIAAATSDNPETRRIAWDRATRLTPADIPVLGELMLHGTASESTTAYLAIERIAFHDAAANSGAGEALLSLVASEASPEEVSELPFPEAVGLFEFLQVISSLTEAKPEEVPDLEAIAWKRRVIDLIRLAGGEGQVAELRALVDDDTAAENACAAMANIPGTAARTALEKIAAADERPRLQAQALSALARRRETASTPALRAMAANGPYELQWKALETLADLGISPEETRAFNPAWTVEEKTRYASAGLCAGQRLLRDGRIDEAREIFRAFSSLCAQQYQIRGALIGLSASAPEDAREYALTHLSSAGARRTAIDVLAKSLDEEAVDRLLGAYETAQPAVQSGILEALHRGQSARLEGLLRRAVLSPDPEVRFTALRLSGLEPTEEDLAPLVVQGSPWVQREALRAFLDLAHARAIAGDSAAAASQFRGVVDGPFPAAFRREALEGLGMLALEQDVDLARGYTTDPELGQTAQVALIRITAAHANTEEAVRSLTQMVRSALDPETLKSAAEALEELGAGTETQAQMQGFLRDWQVLGPVPREAPQDLAQQFGRESGRKRPAAPEFGGVQFDWKAAVASGMPARLDLQQVIGPYQEVSAFAYTEIRIPAWSPITVEILASGSPALWLNGEAVDLQPPANPGSDGAFQADTLLRPGVNRMLLSLQQAGPGWEFSLRLLDRQGKPIDMNEQWLPSDGLGGVGLQAGTAASTASEDVP